LPAFAAWRFNCFAVNCDHLSAALHLRTADLDTL
jgi:hypothetical protein